MIPRIIALWALCTSGLVGCLNHGSSKAPPAPASSPPPPTTSTSAHSGRLVGLGDLHGDLDSALAVLEMAGVVGADGHWSGGTSILVQTGDTTDRGPDSRGVIELMQRLEQEAQAAGGQVVALLGNHEVMNLTGDLRYVSDADMASFESPADRQAAFALTGPLGSWLIEKDIVALVGDTVFAHGGIAEGFAQSGIAAINASARAALRGQGPTAVLRSEGPLWYRAYLLADEPIACAELSRALDALGGRRMVVGHTTQRSGKIAARCGGALLGIDTGISAHYGSNLAAIEIIAGDARALYPDGVTVDLPDPAP